MTFLNLITAFREKFPPYIKTSKKLNIYDYTALLLADFMELLNNVEESEYVRINGNKQDLMNKIKIQSNIILSAIDLFCSGDIVGCYESIYKTYFYEGSDIYKILRYKPIPARGPLFRLRVNKSNRPFEHTEMFHIPFGKTHLVSNQRFSLAGYPCLYLGNSSYCCWEELNRPDMERCNFAVLRNEKLLNLLDLSPPTEIRHSEDLLAYPLIISCALKITEDHSSFKSEYIIPQAVLQSIIKLNNKAISDINLDGIIYLSTRIGEKLFFNDDNEMYNYVIPTIYRKENRFCHNLTKLFTISEAITYQELWLKYPQLVAAFDEDLDVGNDLYKLSVFFKIEQFLKGRTIKKFTISEN